jgi:hypothetical protein
MSRYKFFVIRIFFTVIASIAVLSLLFWQHFNGGVPAHHILADKSLPIVSNWAGAAVIPLLSWLLSYRIQNRVFGKKGTHPIIQIQLRLALFGILGGLIFGILLAGFFTLGLSKVPGCMIMALFPIALLYPIYRSEHLLGFVIGMTFTFGALLPTIFGLLLTLISFVLWRYVRFAILRVISKIRPVRENTI